MTAVQLVPRVDLAPDAALPARDRLLDPAAVAEALSGLLGADRPLQVGGCELLRVKYRIGESLRVLYRLRPPGSASPVLVTGRAFPAGRSAGAHARALRQTVPTGPLRPVVHDRAHQAVWWTFPNDRRMTGVAGLLHPAGMPGAETGGLSAWVGSDVVQYAPERSVTLRAYDDEGATVGYAKCYAPGTTDVHALATRYDVVARRLAAASGAVSSPRALAHVPERQLLVLEAMGGSSWLTLGSRRQVDAMRRLGESVSVIHATPRSMLAGCGLARFGRLEMGRLHHGAELVARARPDLSAAALSLAVRLAAGAPEAAEPVLLHGDCHPGNVLADRDGLSVIDLDQAGLGPAAADVGSLLARLRYGAIVGEHDHAATAAMSDAFLQGYAEHHRLPAHHDLRWHTAAALLGERALRAVNRIRPVALSHLAEVLDAGHLALDERN